MPTPTIRSHNLLPGRRGHRFCRRGGTTSSTKPRTEDRIERPPTETTEPGREQQHADSRRETSAVASAARRRKRLGGMRQENNRTIRSRHAVHRATKYPIGRLLGASSISIPTSPDASPRTIAPGAPGLKLRNAPVVTFHVTIGAIGQARPQRASLPFRNCRFLSVRKRHCCCRQNAKHQQKHRHPVKVQHRMLILGPASIGANHQPGIQSFELIPLRQHSIWSFAGLIAATALAGEITSRFGFGHTRTLRRRTLTTSMQ
jgi:hypothetical protein